MTLPEPTIVFRSRSYPAADSLVAYLVEGGIKAHLVGPATPFGHSHAGDGPIFGTVYDVLAADCSPTAIDDLLRTWHQLQSEVAASNDLFCYHCGDVLDAPSTSCPRCGELLETSTDATT
ncbi:hypothetical protein LF1_52370 [Rubripirellula obstinata]|uniref:DUF2007 domain-containing protein n=1 Tax=Rubripirellula obstinata TaxID=406547 RepID=A0A5B1C8D6_9BACT|nr:hypothetical protein [Rubripirellula obstinata]KAA1257388.1 hypothetical protein LF1_52370 [Rubripirellula obstinata]